MHRTGETTKDARQVLLGYLEGGQTGCLVARSERGEVQVFVMLGEVLAAHVPEDGANVLQLLRNEGGLEPGVLEGLRVRVTGGMPISEALFDAVSDPRVLDLLFERFRDNLFAFLTSAQVGDFTPMEAVFTDNIQVGHDSRALVEELWALRRNVAGLLGGADLVLAPGSFFPREREQVVLRELCGESMTLSSILARAPWETSRTLERLQGMIGDGALVVRAPAGDIEDEFGDDEPPTEEHPREPTGEVEAPVDPEMAAFQDYDTSRIGGDFTSDRKLLDRVDLDAVPKPRAPGPVPSETVIEMEDAEHAGKEVLAGVVSLNFSGPKLHDTEAQRKIEVVNDVLATIASALDAVEGRGAGQAHLQLLVEGSQGTIAPLFKQVEVTVDGRLPVEQVLKNLRRRPQTEHRGLLSRGLGDLIERSLSFANESLDEQGLEEMLEHIAGYQQRLGI